MIVDGWIGGWVGIAQVHAPLCPLLSSSPPLPHIRARWRLRRIENTALFPVNGLLDL